MSNPKKTRNVTKAIYSNLRAVGKAFVNSYKIEKNKACEKKALENREEK